MSECKRCKNRGQTWKGDPPRCAFRYGERFTSDNWNCATMNELRELAEEYVVASEDQKMACLPVDSSDYLASHLLLGWYKSRGRVETALWVHENLAATLTIIEAERILNQKGAGEDE